jgi:hypothetical protein
MAGDVHSHLLALDGARTGYQEKVVAAGLLQTGNFTPPIHSFFLANIRLPPIPSTPPPPKDIPKVSGRKSTRTFLGCEGCRRENLPAGIQQSTTPIHDFPEADCQQALFSSR